MDSVIPFPIFFTANIFIQKFYFFKNQPQSQMFKNKIVTMRLPLSENSSFSSQFVCLFVSLAQSKNFILYFDALFVELWRLIEGSRAVFARVAFSER